jgi:hypothetical protein
VSLNQKLIPSNGFKKAGTILLDDGSRISLET